MGKKAISDQQIIKWLRSGKEDPALEQIYRDNYETIERFVVSNSGTKVDARDLFQDTIIVFYKKVLSPKFKLTSSIKTYLYSIARNTWLKQLKKSGNPLTMDTLSVELAEISSELERDLEWKNQLDERTKISIQELEKMGNPCTNLLYQYYFYKKSMKEIVETMAYKNTNTAKNQKYKCMKRLQKMVMKRIEKSKAKSQKP